MSGVVHRCPICGVLHFVAEARARFAYGRPYTCSFECEARRRRAWYERPSRTSVEPLSPAHHRETHANVENV
jgi:hypothetical protein